MKNRPSSQPKRYPTFINLDLLLFCRMPHHANPAVPIFRFNPHRDQQQLWSDWVRVASKRSTDSNLSAENLCVYQGRLDPDTVPEHQMYTIKINSANRLCKMYGCKADFSFSLKCMFKDNPLILIGIFFTISSMIFAFQIYLVERRAAFLA